MNAGGPVPGGTVSSLPQGSQMTRQARRLYVGNIPFGITEVQLKIIYVLTAWRFENYFCPLYEVYTNLPEFKGILSQGLQTIILPMHSCT